MPRSHWAQKRMLPIEATIRIAYSTVQHHHLLPNFWWGCTQQEEYQLLPSQPEKAHAKQEGTSQEQAGRLSKTAGSVPSMLLGEKAVLGGVKFFPDALKLLQEQPHILGVLHYQNILTVVLDGLCGPIEGASDEHLLVNNGKLMVHVAQVLVMPYLYTLRSRPI